MDFNKFAGAILASLLLMVGLRTFIEIFYPKGEENLSKGKIVVTSAPIPSPAATTQNAAAEQQDPPVEKLLASANLDSGQSAMKQCATCHNWVKGGGNKVGPNLYGVVGRETAKEPGFTYSAALQQKGGQWTPENLYEWIKNPKTYAPGNKMGFAGVKDAQERANIIAYLNKQSDSPLVLAKQ